MELNAETLKGMFPNLGKQDESAIEARYALIDALCSSSHVASNYVEHTYLAETKVTLHMKNGSIIYVTLE